MAMVQQKDYENTPEGWYKLWMEELKTSDKNLEVFHKRASAANRRFLDERSNEDITRLNLFHSNITTLRSFLFGNAPKSDVGRRYADANDDVGRVASETLRRMINNDIEESGNTFSAVLQCSLDDRLLAGLGCARVRYVLETGTREIEPYQSPEGETVSAESYMTKEEADVEYVHWRDVRWGFCRTWDKMPWMAFRAYLRKDEVAERFGEDVAERLEYKEIGPNTEKEEEYEGDAKDSWQRACVWELWSKRHRKCFWLSPGGYDKILDTKDDPLGLKGFWPTPKWMAANTTTTIFEPIPDYYFAQDIYNEIDDLENRICLLTDAVKAVGVYDEAAKGIARMLNEGVDNELIPIKDWQRFSEKGGLEGSVDWLPLEAIVAAIDKLRELLAEKIAMLFQITGLSDIMRGQSSSSKDVSATEQKIKTKFGSIRIQSMQDEFARYASELAGLKAEIICKHFSPQTIAETSGMQSSMDAQLLPQAIQLLKSSWDDAAWRIEIKPETVAMTDYQQLQSERVEYLNGLATFMQSSVPLVQLHPAAAPVLLEMLKWGLAGFKGSQQIEGVLDRAIQTLTSQPPAQKPDPDSQKMKLEAQKQQGEERQRGQEMMMKSQEQKQEMQMKREEHAMEMQQAKEELKTTMVVEDQKRKTSALKGLIDIAKMEQKGEMDSKKKPSV